MGVKAEGEWWEGFNERQRRFYEAYSSYGGNATRAAREGGYENHDPQGSINLGNARIVATLEKLREGTTNAGIMTREERQRMWSEMAMDATPEPQHRLRASELLGNSQGDFIGRREVTVQQLSDLSDDELRAELDALRRRNAELRGEKGTQH